jgi:hypothetical protein
MNIVKAKRQHLIDALYIVSKFPFLEGEESSFICPPNENCNILLQKLIEAGQLYIIEDRTTIGLFSITEHKPDHIHKVPENNLFIMNTTLIQFCNIKEATNRIINFAENEGLNAGFHYVSIEANSKMTNITNCIINNHFVLEKSYKIGLLLSNYRLYTKAIK